MEEYLEDACAPQWVDFIESRNLKVTQDFFNKADTTESKEKLPDSTSKNIQPTSQEDVSPSNAITKMQEDLRNIKSIPVKMTPNCNNKKVVTAITYDKVYTDAIRTLEFCQRPSKNRDANKINQESTVFKTPGVSKITKSSKSIASYSVFNQRVQSSGDMLKSEKINEKMKNVNMRRTLPSHYLFKLDAACVKNNASKVSHACLLDYNNNKEKDKEPNEHSDGLKKESNEELNGENNEEHEKKNNDEFKNESGDRNEENNKEQQNELQELMDDKKDEEGNNQDDVNIVIGKTKRRQSNKLPSLLTWQNHRRRSMYKRRSSTSTSLAETIPCFQNETPKRFRARNTKNNTPTLINPSKLMENRIPISPTLISTGACAVIVPSQEERRKSKLEKKIKAKPVPPGASRMSPKVAKRPASTYSATQSKSGKTACATNLSRRKNLPLPAGHDKTSSGSKNTVPKITVTDTEGIVKHQAISFFGVPKEKRPKSVTRVQPFSFEERNKVLQMKKEQKLKNLQENNVIKRKFRARPAPNFSKPVDASRRRKNVDSSTENKNTQETKNAACVIDKRKRK